MRIFKTCMLFLMVWTCLVLGIFAQSPDASLNVTVEAGPRERVATPVYIEVDLPAGRGERACVISQGQEFAAQIERLGQGRARVWWIVSLPAYSSQVFRIDFQRDCSELGFSWRETSEDSTDLLLANLPVLRYVHPRFSREDIEHTKKPFHHVFDPAGGGLITKGPGGLYSHHRGIFFGYNHVFVGEERLDIWHANNGEHQQHEENLNLQAGPVFGGHQARILWKDREGRPFVEELRQVRAFRQPDGQALLEFTSRLKSLKGLIQLGGDRQHAGLQFRAAQEVAESREHSRFLRPSQWAHLPSDAEVNTPEHVGLPWNALQFTLQDRRITVAYLSDSSNPEGAEMSERLYGRFGEFFPYQLDGEHELRIRYRFWVVSGQEASREDIERRYRDLTEAPQTRLE